MMPDAGLLVSPDHRVMVRGRAGAGVVQHRRSSGHGVIERHVNMRRSPMREVHYIHMLLPSHEVVFANGVESEVFIQQALVWTTSATPRTTVCKVPTSKPT
jgi:hypothetical protein